MKKQRRTLFFFWLLGAHKSTVREEGEGGGLSNFNKEKTKKSQSSVSKASALI